MSTQTTPSTTTSCRATNTTRGARSSHPKRCILHERHVPFDRLTACVTAPSRKWKRIEVSCTEFKSPVYRVRRSNKARSREPCAPLAHLAPVVHYRQLTHKTIPTTAHRLCSCVCGLHSASALTAPQAGERATPGVNRRLRAHRLCRLPIVALCQTRRPRRPDGHPSWACTFLHVKAVTIARAGASVSYKWGPPLIRQR